jgi:hypothetical protein
MQRPRSSPSARRSPLARHLLGRPGDVVVGIIGSLLLVTLSVGASRVTAAEPPSEPFVLDSTPSTYPFSMRLEGTLQRDGETMVVNVKGGEVRSTIPAELGADGLATEVVISFGLGKVVPDGWQMTNDTEPYGVSAELRPGESLPVTPHRFVVKGLTGLPVADVWLAARLTVKQKLPGLPAGPLSSYACAEPNLAGMTPASRERARAMAQNYAHT